MVLVAFGIEGTRLNIVCWDLKMGLSKRLVVRQESCMEVVGSKATDGGSARTGLVEISCKTPVPI